MCVCVCVRTCYLQVRELPGPVVVLGASLGEGLSEVHLDQLPVGAVADVSKHPGDSNRNNLRHQQVALSQVF